MVIRATDPEIDWSTFPESDGQPMAETTANLVQMLDLIWSLQRLCAIQGRGHTTAVGGNQLVYYNPANGRDHLSPDVYVVLDYGPHPPPSWKTWVEGKFPDVVFEITSPTTHVQDLSLEPKGKLRLYAELGAKEYYVYDPQQETEPPFLGFAAREGRMEPLPKLESGGIMSPLLGTELRPIAMVEAQWQLDGTWLRVIDPWTGQPILLAEEERQAAEQALRTAEQQIRDEEVMRQAAEQARQAAEQARQAAEQRARDEEAARQAGEQARLAAEERAAQAEAALQKLLADMARSQGTISEQE